MNDFVTRFKVIELNLNFPISALKSNSDYQRSIESKRISKIATSMKKYGYWGFEIVLVNQNHEIIDGQHRVSAANRVGYKTIPVCILEFDTKQDEIMFFIDKNNHNCTLNQIDFWDARKEFGNIIAKIIYQLDSDVYSRLYERISLKRKRGSYGKFSISQVLMMLFNATGNSAVWTRASDRTLENKIINKSYVEIRAYINKLVEFFELSFGIKGKNLAYDYGNFRSILLFYYLVNKNGNAFYKNALLKMKKFSINSEFTKMSHSAKVHSLVSHFNSGRNNGIKIDYSEIQS